MGINHFNCKKLVSFNLVHDKLIHHSITPSFHYSNWGEAPKFCHTISGIFSLSYRENSPLGNFLRENEALLLWTKLIKPVINNLL